MIAGTGITRGGEPLPDVVVLCFHGISKTWKTATAIGPAQFRELLELMLDRGYCGATFSEALTAPPAARVVVVTFDDAHRSVREHAEPIMSSLGVPGTVFVPTDYPDSGRPFAWDGIQQWHGGPHEGELACMSWQEIRTLAGIGWEIGSHTCSHPHLVALDDERLEVELRVSRETLEAQLSQPCASVAYPYGECDGRVARAAASAGYRLGATVAPNYAPPLPMQWPRINVSHHEVAPRFRWRVSQSARRAGLSPVGRSALRAARGVKGVGRRALGSVDSKERQRRKVDDLRS